MRRHRRGSAAIEFALVAPLLVAMLAGIADYGWLFDRRMAVVLVARDAARAGSLTPLGEDVVLQGELRGEAALASAGLSGDVSCVLIGFTPDQRVRCEVRVPFAPLVGLLPSPKEIRADLTMRMEEQP